jgi:hypothetical protein
MMLTRARTDIMLDRLESDGFVLKLWRHQDGVDRVAAPALSSKPATVRRWIKAFRADCADVAANSQPPLPKGISKVALSSS